MTASTKAVRGRTETAPRRLCTICGDQLHRHRGARGDRCGTCSRYHQRHHTDRPEHLIIRLTEKDIERELTRRANSC